MEKINLEKTLKIVAFFALGGLLMFAAAKFYPENLGGSAPTALLAQDTLLTYKFKSVGAYDKPQDTTATAPIDKGCSPVDLDLIVLGDTLNGASEVHLVFNMVEISTTDVFQIVMTNPNNSNQILVVDKFDRRHIFTMICFVEDGVDPVEHPDHKHWFVMEGLTDFAVYSTEDGECEFLNQGN